jgi:imidazole glycerol-phosphate synthase subunit HisH
MGSKFMGQDKKLVVIIDYGMGNLLSVKKAFEFLGVDVLLSNKFSYIKKASHLVLPGVGAFGEGMRNLKRLNLPAILKKEVIVSKKPFLGICLGLQLLAKDSEEFGFHEGLGWLDASVKKFDFKKDRLKIPHVGWNSIEIKRRHFLLRGLKQNPEFYFIHSYHMECRQKENIKAVCCYGIEFVAAAGKGNIFAVQFHPEKSQNAGLAILKNFLNWDGIKI